MPPYTHLGAPATPNFGQWKLCKCSARGARLKKGLRRPGIAAVVPESTGQPSEFRPA